MPLWVMKKIPMLLPPSHWLTDLISVIVHKQLPSWKCGYHNYHIVTTLLDTNHPLVCSKIFEMLCYLQKTLWRIIQSTWFSPLQKVRVSANLPFTVAGVHFTGALFVRDNSSAVEHKVYICLFTCAATRAAHLKVVSKYLSFDILSILQS